MVKFNVSTPSGFPEFTPAQERVRQQWIQTISDVFEANGFMPITTPLVEREENFLAKGGNPKEMYVLKRLLDEDGDASHSGNAIRFDHTLPLALYVARHFNDIKFPFRRYAIGPVMRGERAQKGRFRQFDQCDIDIIGSENLSILNDALMPAIIIQIFEKLNIGDFVVRLNNRKILTGIYESVGITDANQIKEVLSIMDQQEKKGDTFIENELLNVGIAKNNIQKILELSHARTGDEPIIQECFRENPTVKEGIQELEEVIGALKSMGIDSHRFCVDLSIVRGLDYYTGTVFETNLLQADGTTNTALGSICSGGRYDDLAEVFTGKKLPGVGISIGLTRLLSQLFEAGIITADRSSPTDVLVLAQDQPYVSDALRVGASLRAAGFRVENYLEPKKIGKQFDYANKLAIPYCVVLGEYEVRDGTVQIKNMTTGEQHTIDESTAVSWFSDIFPS